MKSTSILWLSLALAFGSQSALAGLFSPKGDSPEEKRQVVLKQREEMLAELYKTKPELRDRLPRAAGYATFVQTDINLFLTAVDGPALSPLTTVPASPRLAGKFSWADLIADDVPTAPVHPEQQIYRQPGPRPTPKPSIPRSPSAPRLSMPL